MMTLLSGITNQVHHVSLLKLHTLLCVDIFGKKLKQDADTDFMPDVCHYTTYSAEYSLSCATVHSTA